MAPVPLVTYVRIGPMGAALVGHTMIGPKGAYRTGCACQNMPIGASIAGQDRAHVDLYHWLPRTDRANGGSACWPCQDMVHWGL